MDSALKRRIAEAYYDPSVGLQSAVRLKKRLKDVPLAQIKQFLAGQATSQEFATKRANPYHITADTTVPFNRIQIDLVDMSNMIPRTNNVDFTGFSSLSTHTADTGLRSH